MSPTIGSVRLDYTNKNQKKRIREIKLETCEKISILLYVHVFMIFRSVLCRYHISLMNCVIAFQFPLRTFSIWSWILWYDINISPRQLLNYIFHSLSLVMSLKKLSIHRSQKAPFLLSQFYTLIFFSLKIFVWESINIFSLSLFMFLLC